MAGYPDAVSGSCANLRARLTSADAGRRLGQALWMMAGEPFSQADLLWARGTLGLGGEVLLWNALCEAGCFAADGQLRARDLSRFLCFLVEDPSAEALRPRVVWTLPAQLPLVPGVAVDGYVQAVREAVSSARTTLTMVSPYLEAKGVGMLEEAVVAALQRGVAVTLLTHEADDLASMASAALTSLQSEARHLSGKLAVYATSELGVLLHLKVAVADRQRAVVGSANLTAKGLSGNLEAGTVVGPEDASEICRVVDRVIASGLAKHVFSTK